MDQTCDACLRNALWRVRPNCACRLRAFGGERLHYFACTQHIATVIRVHTENHRTHVGQRASEMIISEIPK